MLAARPAGLNHFNGLPAASPNIAGQHDSCVMHSQCTLKMHAAHAQMHLAPALATKHLVSHCDTYVLSHTCRGPRLLL